MKYLIFFLLTLTLIGSCSSQKKDESPKVASESLPTPQSGVLQKVDCPANLTVSYYLYLPKNFVAGKPFPVLVMFDPKARGKMIAEKMVPFAEKYGYVLIGSNCNKNGLEFSAQKDFYSEIMIDFGKRVKADKKRIYLAGFSGGARVAQTLAGLMPEIKGIACCGAGTQETINRKADFSYISFAGNWDFNYYEVRETERIFKNAQFPNRFMYFDGKHDWSPAEVLENLFMFFESEVMNQGIIPKDEKLIADFAVSAESFKGKSQTDENLAGEQEELKSLLSGFGTKDYTWWKTELARLKKMQAKKSKTAEWYAAKRMLGSLSLYSYLYSVKALDGGSPTMAALFTYIYSEVDAENPDLNYLNARIAASSGKTETALEELKKAVAKDFDDYERLEKDKILSSLPVSELQKIILEIKKKR